ncbi:MAG: outer membrane protein assembly factor BamD [Bacteroidaceae bacterium]|nr:outer membrane protein assembly factor BamD [Bacteroidaceae bacterium]
MKNIVVAFGILLFSLVSCGEYIAVQKSPDMEYRYEAAKSYFAEGKFEKSAALLTDILTYMKSTQNGEESLYMLALSEFNARDYETASTYFKKYFQSYPRGMFVEASRYYSALALYRQIPDVRLDQSGTESAIREFQSFVEMYPYSRHRQSAEACINEMQDVLVEKEYLAAKLYYDLGDYVNNCAYGGSNYEACVVTAQNALKEFPFASNERREDLSVLVLRSKYQLAKKSVENKRIDRFRDAIDEYYSFINDYPESRYMNEAMRIHRNADAIVKKKKINLDDED